MTEIDLLNEPHLIDERVGTKIRHLRHAVGMSQAQLGEKCGLTFQQIQKYENATNRVSAGRLYQIAKILGVTVSCFFNEGVSAKEEVDDAAFPLNRSTLELMRYFEGIQDSHIKMSTYKLIKCLAANRDDGTIT